MQKWLDTLQSIDWGQAVATFVTGIVVVFSALLALVIIFWAFGKIMETISNARTKQPKQEKSQPAPASPKLVEVVAAITGAISAILSEEGSNGSFVIRSIKRTRQAPSAWSAAGVLENTRPF